MKLSVIVAASLNHVIGNKNQLPWHLPADLKYFKKITMGHPILMGRITHESIGKPLPGRTNIIISNRPNIEIPDCIVAHSIEEAINLCIEEEEVFVIGGAQIILQTIERADRIYLTQIHHEFEGDTFLPEIDYLIWHEVKREDFNSDDKNAYDYSFIILEKKLSGILSYI